MPRHPGQLGWVPGPEDPRTLRLATYTSPRPEPPRSSNWMRRVPTWEMYRNDRIGCCTIVSCAHLVTGWTTYAAGTTHTMAEADVIAAYAAVSGYNPATGTGDTGARSLDVLNHWRQTGIGGRRIIAYARVNHRDHNEVRHAVHLFGGLFFAALLPDAADDQFRRGRPWRLTVGPGTRAGSWGGHAMHLGGYDTRGLTVSTWGRTQRLSWAWLDAYGAEMYAVLSDDWFDRSGGHNPLGFDAPRLLEDLHRITS